MPGHIVVSGEDALAATVAEELRKAGTAIIRLHSSEVAHAHVEDAGAVVCVGTDDAQNLEIALLTRQVNPRVRVVARLENDVLREGMDAHNGPGAILDVAHLAAPSVVEACLARTSHPFEVAGIEFIVASAEAPRDGTLREIYGNLVPAAVIRGDGSSEPGQVVVCPTRDLVVSAGDWISIIGSAKELSAHGIVCSDRDATRSNHSPLRRALDAARAVRDDVNVMIYPAMALIFALALTATIVVRFKYHPAMSWMDAIYFTAETVSSVGYGDFSFVHQQTWLRVFAAGAMFCFVILTAIIVTFLGDLLLSRRFIHATGRRRVRRFRNHVVVVGMGSFGIRVVGDLIAAGHDVAVIDLDHENPYLSTAEELDVPVIFGDGTMPHVLSSARVDRARAVAVLTQDETVNIETGIVLLEMLGTETRSGAIRTETPLVLRVYDDQLAGAVSERFGFENVRSTVDLAAPWFIGAAMGLEVLQTFLVGQRSFMVGALRVARDSELDGLPMLELSTQNRVLAIISADGSANLYPRRDDRLSAGDTVYLVGPYRELLATLQRGQLAQAAIDGARVQSA